MNDLHMKDMHEKDTPVQQPSILSFANDLANLTSLAVISLLR